MEHHSYAKRGSRKWTIEEKRALINKRIEADEIFNKCSRKMLDPWKKFKVFAKIGNFSEYALRQQWFIMVHKYRTFKDKVKYPFGENAIAEVNREWEFFGVMHTFMSRKTTDLHSYALKEPNIAQPPGNQLAIANVFSCAADESIPEHMLGIINDHSFCERSPGSPESTSSFELNSLTGEEIDDGTIGDADIGNNDRDELNRLVATAMSNSEQKLTVSLEPLEETLNNELLLEMDTSSLSSDSSSGTAFEYSMKTTKSNKSKLKSAKGKYYKRRLQFEQRMEKRLSYICEVMGIALQHLIPDFDLRPLNSMINEMKNEMKGEESEPDIMDDEDSTA